MPNNWIIAIVLIAGGTLLGLLLGKIDSTQDPASIAPVAPSETVAPAIEASGDAAVVSDITEVAELRRILQREIDARRELQRQFEQLRREFDGAQAADNTPAGADAAPSTEPDAAADSDAEVWFNQQALLDSGMDDFQASELKLFFEQLELERLFIRDQADRENWNRADLREALRAVDDKEDDLKSRLSESAYDAYLYASGQTNRVTVASVLESAQASSAGIKSGDHIIRYDNQRIYNWSDLRTAITSGNVSDSVTLEIERNGQRIEFFLARGPLGIRTNSLSVAP